MWLFMSLLFYYPSVYSVKKVQDSQIRLEMIETYQLLFSGGGGGRDDNDDFLAEKINIIQNTEILLDATTFI